MAKLESPKRIMTEDFPSQYKDVVGKLGFSINTFFEQVYNALNGQLNTDNLQENITTVNVTVDATGVPKTQTLVKYTVASIKGLFPIGVTNVTDGTDPSSLPYIKYTQLNNSLIQITKVTGLTADKTYSITLLIKG